MFLSNADAASQAAPGPKAFPLWAAGTAITVMVFVGVQCVDSPAPPAFERALSDAEGLAVCQMVLKRLSRDPETAEVPFVAAASNSGSSLRYAWGPNTRMVRMRNGLGLEVGVPAECVVDREQRRVTSITLDGQHVPF